MSAIEEMENLERWAVTWWGFARGSSRNWLIVSNYLHGAAMVAASDDVFLAATILARIARERSE